MSSSSKNNNFKKKKDFIKNNFSLSQEQVEEIFNIGKKLNTHKYNVWLAKESKKDPSILENYKAISDIIDWVQENKINILQYNFQQAQEKQKEWHENIGNKLNEKVESEEIDKNRILYTSKDGKYFFYILNVDDLQYEGNQMEHCISSNSSYKNKIEEDLSLIVSVRDEDNYPHATIEIDKESRKAIQTSGKRNGKIPEKVNKVIVEFFVETNSIDYIEDKEIYNIIHSVLK